MFIEVTNYLLDIFMLLKTKTNSKNFKHKFFYQARLINNILCFKFSPSLKFSKYYSSLINFFNF